MRHADLRFLVLLAVVAWSAPAWAWLPNGVVWPPERRPVQILLHESSVDEISATELEEITQRSFAVWNQVPCADIQLSYAGLTEQGLQNDDVQVLEWIEDEERWGGLGSMTAGATIINVQNPETGALDVLQIDIGFNGVNFDWEVGGGGIRNVSKLDPENVLTHELGHLLGLGHTRDDAAATMSPSYRPDLSQQTLAWDDKIGICEIYWKTNPSDECTSDADCPEGHTCREHTHEATQETVKLCAEPRGDYGAPCGANNLDCDPCNGDRTCTPLCLFTKTDFSEGFCSTLCEEDEDCPPCWSCYNIQTIGNPFFTCRQDPEEARCAEADAGLDPEPDTDTAHDAAQDTPEEHDADDTPDATPDLPEEMDADPPAPTPTPKSDGCTQAPGAPTPSWPWLGAFLLLSLRRWGSRRARRSGFFVSCLALGLCFGGPREALADEMTFDESETKTKIYVGLMESDKKIKKKDKENIIFALEQSVYELEDAELISPESLSQQLGKKGKNALKCKDAECLFPFAAEVGVDRLLLVKIERSQELFVIDLELYDVATQERLKFDAATSDSVEDTTFISDTVRNLLTPPKPEPKVVRPTRIEPEGDTEEAPRQPEPDGGPWLTRDLANYTMIGGVGLLAVGGVFGLLADNTQATIQAAPHDQATLQKMIDSGKTYQWTANSLLGLGAVTLLTGGVFYFLTDASEEGARSSREPHEGAPDWRLHIGPDGIVWSQSF